MKKPAKTTKRITKEFDRDREFTVILENIHGEIKLLAEGQKALDDKFTGKFNMLYERMGRQEEDIFVLKKDMKSVKSDVSVLKEDMILVKTDIHTIKNDVGEIKYDIKNHDQRLSRLETLKP